MACGRPSGQSGKQVGPVAIRLDRSGSNPACAPSSEHPKSSGRSEFAAPRRPRWPRPVDARPTKAARTGDSDDLVRSFTQLGFSGHTGTELLNLAP